MIDRVSANPGRVLITPENGEAYYATLTRADNPTVPGTPLNKSTLLTDATAALYSLGSNAVPDDVFESIRSLISNAQNTANQKISATTGRYTGDDSSRRTIELGFRPVAILVLEGGTRVGFYSGKVYGYWGGLATSNYSASSEAGTVVSTTSNGFRVYTKGNGTSSQVTSNGSGYTYNYIAFQ